MVKLWDRVQTILRSTNYYVFKQSLLLLFKLFPSDWGREGLCTLDFSISIEIGFILLRWINEQTNQLISTISTHPPWCFKCSVLREIKWIVVNKYYQHGLPSPRYRVRGGSIQFIRTAGRCVGIQSTIMQYNH